MEPSTACLIIIGNEILSGRTQDKNLSWLAKTLNEAGVQMRECRVIPDIEETIIETVNALRGRYTYVFTTGGIGPTHDDITSASIAKAFGVPLIRHPDAEMRLRKHYGAEINEARLKMTETPEGARLIDNPISIAPGFIIENVHVMAGVPAIMQAMVENIKHTLRGGAKMLSRSLTATVTEGMIAAELTEIQIRYREVEIGSYPYMAPGELRVSIVLRSADAGLLAQAADEVRGLLRAKAGAEPEEN